MKSIDPIARQTFAEHNVERETSFGASGTANGSGFSRCSRFRGLICYLAMVCLQTMRRRMFSSNSR